MPTITGCPCRGTPCTPSRSPGLRAAAPAPVVSPGNTSRTWRAGSVERFRDAPGGRTGSALARERSDRVAVVQRAVAAAEPRRGADRLNHVSAGADDGIADAEPLRQSGPYG